MRESITPGLPTGADYPDSAAQSLAIEMSSYQAAWEHLTCAIHLRSCMPFPCDPEGEHRVQMKAVKAWRASALAWEAIAIREGALLDHCLHKVEEAAKAAGVKHPPFISKETADERDTYMARYQDMARQSDKLFAGDDNVDMAHEKQEKEKRKRSRLRPIKRPKWGKKGGKKK